MVSPGWSSNKRTTILAGVLLYQSLDATCRRKTLIRKCLSVEEVTSVLVKQTASDLFSENKRLTTKKKQAVFFYFYFFEKEGGKVTKERGGHQHPEKRKNNEGGSIAISDTLRVILWTIWSLFFLPYVTHMLCSYAGLTNSSMGKKRETLLPSMV